MTCFNVLRWKWWKFTSPQLFVFPSIIFFYSQEMTNDAKDHNETRKKISGRILMLLNQYVSHDFDVPGPIIYIGLRINAARVAVIRVTPWAKPDSWIAGVAFIIFVVSNDTDSCLGTIRWATYCIEPFYVAVTLQGALGTKQTLPLITTHWCGSELPVSNQWVQRVSTLVKGDKIRGFLARDLHAKTDLVKWRVPVSW